MYNVINEWNKIHNTLYNIINYKTLWTGIVYNDNMVTSDSYNAIGSVLIYTHVNQANTLNLRKGVFFCSTMRLLRG